MAICPRCSSQIFYLLVKSEDTYVAKFLDSEGGFTETGGVRQSKAYFICPVCLSFLYDLAEQEKAEQLLKGDS